LTPAIGKVPTNVLNLIAKELILTKIGYLLILINLMRLKIHPKNIDPKVNNQHSNPALQPIG